MTHMNDLSKLLVYFKPNYKMALSPVGFRVYYYFALDSGTLGIWIYEHHDLVNNKVEIADCENRIDRSISNEFVINYVKEVYKETFEHDLVEYENKFFARETKKKIDSFCHDMTSIMNSVINNDKNKLSLNNQVEVEYYFSYYNNSLYLSLKVGNSKYYTVKNIEKFFNAITNNEVITYGKNLSFFHTIENFKEEEQDILIFIKNTCKFLNYTNYKECIIPTDAIKTLFDKLEKRIVYFDNIPYIVRLSKLDVNVSIDENYLLHCSLKNVSLIPLQSCLLVLDNTQCVIDYVDSSYSELISFSNKYDGFNLKPVLKNFKENMYVYYHNHIEVADQIKDDFKVATLVIKAYFDYHLGVISVKPKYYKNDMLVEETQIIDYFDVLKHKSFNDYLTELGFVENCMKNQDQIYHFFTMDFTYLKTLCEVYLSESIANKQIVKFNAPSISVKRESTLMKILMQESTYTNEELYKIFKAIKQKKKYYILNNNIIIDLNNNQANDFCELVEELNLDEKELTKEFELPIYQSFKLRNFESNLSDDDFYEQMIKDIAEFKKAKYSLPSINAKLRPYQIEGFKWLKVLTKYNLGGILADDMGLGKTLEIITFLKSDNEQKPSLIVCPKSLIFNWYSEFEKFDKDTKVVQIYGNQAERKHIIDNIKENEKIIYITSYDSLRNDEDDYKVQFNYVILDEGQYIKNIYAKKTKTVKSIKGIHRFVLTGTPIENNVYDIWSLFDFIMPGYLPNIDDFKAKVSDETYLTKLSKKISPFILRRTKKEVLKDLPSKYEKIVTAELTKEQQKLYDAYILQAKDKLNEDNAMISILSFITRLRQICVDPHTFIDNYEGTSGKLETLYNLLDDYIENGHRVLIFSQFVKALDLISQKLNDKKISHYILTGETKALDRIKLTNDFNNNENIKVFLISLKAGGTGLNLVGADTVIHLDPWWNVSAENQATDRTHRIGQTSNVEVVKLICRDTIEQRVIELQNIKKDLIDKLISHSDSSITKLTKEDLEFILK